MKNYNLYIHIPFCTSKCKYCRFASFSGLNNLKINNYVDFLCREIINQPPSPLPHIKEGELDTIYFGGGTPGVLTLKQFEKILKTLKNKYTFSKNIEISIESTPENITRENIIGWKKLGINRISMGVQSLNEKTLGEIGRVGKGDIINALENVKEVIYNPPKSSFNSKGGLENLLSLEKNAPFSIKGSCPKDGGIIISIDFIIGLPYVKSGEIKENLNFLLNNYSFIKHVSVYMLEEYYDVPDEKDSKFENITYPNDWSKLGISEDKFLEEYTSISDFLKTKGIEKYEISNFSKLGYECKHNQGYWTHKETLAFGLGAFGFVNNIRFSNSENFLEYYNLKNISSEKLDEQDLFIEKIMFDLRTSGLEEDDLTKLNREKIEEFIKEGFLKRNKTKIQITNKGTLVLDYILGEII